MHNCRAILLLLWVVHSVSAMRVYPADAEPKKNCCVRVCAWLCSWKLCKTQEERDREQNLRETERIMQEAERKRQDGIQEQRKKELLRTKSGVLREAAALTHEGRHRRETGKTSDPEHIKNFLKTRQVLTVPEATQYTLHIARSVTPLGGGALMLTLPNYVQTTARSSARESLQAPPQEVSPTPPALSQATTTLSVEDV